MKKGITAIAVSPILWGGAACFGFYTLIRRGIIHDELVIRYTAGHPVEYVTVALFFIGMASLLFKFLRVGLQKRRLRLGVIFPPIKKEKEPISEVEGYLKSLKKAVSVRGESLHTSRLRRALQFLQSGGRVDDLDQELRSLADDDLYAADSDYGMVKMFIWAIPILGFLGTVIGITAALGNLNLTELETTGKLLASGLKVAFDTTALALSLVFVLYFTQYFVQLRESRCFARVEQLVDRELRGRFLPASSPLEEEGFKASRRVLQSLTEAFDTVIKHQAETWQEAMRQAVTQGNEAVQQNTARFQASLQSALGESLEKYARQISAGEEDLFRKTISPVIRSMDEHLSAVAELRDKVVEETETIQELFRADGEIARLEERLNQRLRSLSGTEAFSETLGSLSEAVQLLNHRLKETSDSGASEPFGGPADRGKSRYSHPETIRLRNIYGESPSAEPADDEPATYSIRIPKLGTGFWRKKKSA
ncbi:MAG: MotA/TolQ/ExbB proton channel family protein [Thermoguttaceae bacterium]|nr:MotA/TolQ/ExbB proton channel family protein [Thermoguttaceae bacterium]